MLVKQKRFNLEEKLTCNGLLQVIPCPNKVGSYRMREVRGIAKPCKILPYLSYCLIVDGKRCAADGPGKMFRLLVWKANLTVLFRAFGDIYTRPLIATCTYLLTYLRVSPLVSYVDAGTAAT